MSIESLFIDEGFGTLDSETLRTVMSPLPHMAALRAGDRIRVEDASASLRLCADSGCVPVTAKEAGKTGYTVSAQGSTSAWKNFAGWLGELKGRGAQVVAARTRGEEQEKYPAI